MYALLKCFRTLQGHLLGIVAITKKCKPIMCVCIFILYYNII